MKLDKYHFITITEDDHSYTEVHGHNLCDEACGCECGNTGTVIEQADGCSGFPPGK